MDTTAMCKHHREARRSVLLCLTISLALLLLLAVVATVLYLTVLRPRAADTSVTSVRLAGLYAGLSSATVSALDVNVTLAVALAIHNPNAASFAYNTGHAEVYYSGILAGEAAIPPGHISAGGEEVSTVYLTVLAGRLAGYASQLYGDVVGAGIVPLAMRTTVPGTVTVLGVLRHRMVMYTTCDVAVSVQRQGVPSSQCRYRTKF